MLVAREASALQKRIAIKNVNYVHRKRYYEYKVQARKGNQ